MSNETNTSQTPVPGKVRFSYGSILLWLAIAALTINTVIMNRHVARLEQDLASQRPLAPREVARQFEERTSLGPLTTTVKDVRYSPEADAYRVEFSYANSGSGETWHSDVRLNHDGFGTYFGQIRGQPFIEPLGHKDFFPVSVKTPSPLDRSN